MKKAHPKSFPKGRTLRIAETSINALHQCSTLPLGGSWWGLLILSLFSLSCQEDFNPKTDFKEQYVLNCYVDLDYDKYQNTQVYATVSKLYNVDDFDPSQNKIDPTVSGAEIYLNYRDFLYKLREDTNKAVTTKYGTNQIYYTTTLQNIYPSYNVSISAKTPDGKVLTAQTQLLEASQLSYSYNFRKDFTTKINRFLWGESFTISWAYLDNRLFFPQLLIRWGKIDDKYSFFKEVPCTFVRKGNHFEPVYPTYTNSGNVSFDYAAIDSAMAQISAGDTAKNKYQTVYIRFQLMEMDLQLSKYYESLHGILDSYSVSLDESVYSNIQGGLGIFGSKRILTSLWYLDSAYVRSFGYH